jgi:hypothetical protein
MYQPYPTGGGADQVAPRPPQPPSVVNAVRLMYAGAGLSAIGLIFDFVGLSSVKKTLEQQHPDMTTAQINSIETVTVAVVVVVGLLGIGLWIWMALANGKGKSWARIVASVLFALSTLDLLISLAGVGVRSGFILGILVWLVGLAAIILLWRKDSSAFFQPNRPM